MTGRSAREVEPPPPLRRLHQCDTCHKYRATPLSCSKYSRLSTLTWLRSLSFLSIAVPLPPVATVLVSFVMIVFKPFVNEILQGRIKSCSANEITGASDYARWSVAPISEKVSCYRCRSMSCLAVPALLQSFTREDHCLPLPLFALPACLLPNINLRQE